ncbi:MAG: response regulator [Syntrophomonadaceae bacterium]|nr:response regulator [Syntrophomonadaceae bacterium]MDD3024376.1 response regulator [Syntrophomonadaceae bacterium]
MKKKILSVDDSAIVRIMLKKGVEGLGYDFSEAADGQEALSVLASEFKETALILLDWNMPGMNGMEFLNIIKADARYKRIPVMMVTTESEKASIVKAIQSGVSNYMLKPFGEDELKKKILACLGGRT